MNIEEELLTKLMCTVCKLPLSVSPVTVNSSGNFICGRCPSEGAAINSIYEALAQNFVFPCRYQPNGCRNTLKWGTVKDHEENCSKKLLMCPMAVSEDSCAWYGPIGDIVQHFDEAHSDHIADSIEIGLNEDALLCNLSKTNEGAYISYFNFKDGVLQFRIFQLIEFDSFKKRQCQVICRSRDSSRQIQIATVDIEHYNLVEPQLAFTKIHAITREVLRFLKKRNTTSFLSEIVITSGTSSTISKELLKTMECIVCRDYMRPPIRVCFTGHSLCYFCFMRLDYCPLCQAQLADIRNFALEDIANQLFGSSENERTYGELVLPLVETLPE